MAKKKSKKKTPPPKKKEEIFPTIEKEEEGVEREKNEEETALVVPTIECSCVGKVFEPAGSNFRGRCVKQRWVESIQMSLLYFEGNVGPYCSCVCKLVEEKEGEDGKKNDSKD